MSDERSRGSAPAYGWQDFDPEVVAGLVENDSRFVNRRTGGWIACPLSGHFGEELAWQEDNYRKGSVLHGNPPASFRAAPTYVLERPLDNFLVGRNLIAEGIAGRWGNSEAPRLGNENSEGALAWNVMRSLQEAARLSVAACVLAGLEAAHEPDLFFWGQRIAIDHADAWTELQSLRDELEQGLAQPMIEPDACLHVPGFGWLVIEASFGPSAEGVDDPARIEAFLERYAAACPGLFDEDAIRKVKLREFPLLLLRTITLAHKLRAEGEQAVVVALVRESDPAAVERTVGRCLAETADVGFRRVTWESLYGALPDEPELGRCGSTWRTRATGSAPRSHSRTMMTSGRLPGSPVPEKPRPGWKRLSAYKQRVVSFLDKALDVRRQTACSSATRSAQSP